MAYSISNVWLALVSLLRLNLFWFYVFGDDDDTISNAQSGGATATQSDATSKGAIPKTRIPDTADRDDGPPGWIDVLEKKHLVALLRKHNLTTEGNTHQLARRVKVAVEAGVIVEPLPELMKEGPFPDEDRSGKDGDNLAAAQPTGPRGDVRDRPSGALPSGPRHTTPSWMDDERSWAQPAQRMGRSDGRGTEDGQRCDAPPLITPAAGHRRTWGPHFTSETATLCNAVRKWNLRFDGRKNSDAVSFMERLHELMDAYDVPQECILKALPELLKDSALLWYRNNRDFWATFSDFLRDFQLQYLPGNYRSHLDDEISKRTQGEGELFRQFVVAISTLIRRRGRMTEYEKLERIYTNMHPNYKMYVRRRDFTSLPELVRVAEEYEACMRERQSYKPPPGPAQAMMAETAYSGRNRAQPIQTTYGRSALAGIQGEADPRRTTLGITTQDGDHGTPDNRSRGHHGKTDDRTRPSDSDIKPSPPKDKMCWNCDSYGHIYRDCRKPKMIRCFYCKRAGVKTTSCGCRQTGNGPRVSENGGLRNLTG